MIPKKILIAAGWACLGCGWVQHPAAWAAGLCGASQTLVSASVCRRFRDFSENGIR